MGGILGLWKYVHIRKSQDYFPTILGLHILNLLRQGYNRFEIEEYEEVLVLKALKKKRGAR